VPLADGTLFVLRVSRDDVLMPSLLILSDVMGTGHHAAATANVRREKTLAIVGDGAVGLCGVIAAKRLGAEQIIMLGRHADRIARAKVFGATDIVSERAMPQCSACASSPAGSASTLSSSASALKNQCIQRSALRVPAV
jgi:threonine dehydrogenase-like Zn-dependent dehydrogenase